MFTDLTLIIVVVTSLLFDCSVFSLLLLWRSSHDFYCVRWCEIYKWLCFLLFLLQYGVWTFWHLRCRSSSISFHLLWSWMSKSFISLRLQSFIWILGRECSLELWVLLLGFFSFVCVWFCFLCFGFLFKWPVLCNLSIMNYVTFKGWYNSFLPL